MGNLLNRVDSPADLRHLSLTQLRCLAEEIRDELVNTVTETGGHLASNLGVVELTIALHSVFDSPRDKVIWDVGHQSYVHKLLTGRRERFATLRQLDGLSGFTDPGESPYDAFGAGHACTSISAALGIAVARDLKGEDYQVVAVTGDGAMTGGMALEAVNNAGHLGNKLIVILNDNQMSISPSVGAIAKYLGRLRANPRYFQVKADAERLLMQLPWGKETLAALKRLKHSVKGLVIQTLLWEELGFTYLGAVDGHDIAALQDILRRAKTMVRPVVVHVYTVKGKGYHPAEQDAVKFHGLPPNGNGSAKTKALSYTASFGKALVELARRRPEIVAITAAMRDGTGLVDFAGQFPKRFFDVGIAEQHAVTFAAGLASRGLRPVVAIYSSFMQRGYDQIIHDVCIPRLPVVFALDRAGIVGDDGRTHQGAFDIPYLRCVPDMVLMAPKDENELQHMLCTAFELDGPSALRYPRGQGMGVPLDLFQHPLTVGKAEVVRAGQDVALIAIGPAVYSALAAAETLAGRGIDACVVNGRFVKPLDDELIVSLAQRCGRLITIEEGALAGGFGSAVLELVQANGLTGVRVHCLGLPDEFVEHGPQDVMRRRYGLTAEGMVEAVEIHFPELLVPAYAGARQG